MSEETQLDPNLDPLKPDDIRLLGGIILLALVAIGLRLGVAWYCGQPFTNYDTSELQSVSFRIDLNEAGWAEISQLPGIGETIARRIVAQRDRLGAFDSLNQLDNIHGIGPMKLSAIEPFLQPFPADNASTMSPSDANASNRDS